MTTRQTLVIGLLITGFVAALLVWVYSVRQLMQPCPYEGMECPHVQQHRAEIPQLMGIGLDIDTVSHQLMISVEDAENSYDNLTPEEFRAKYDIEINWCKEHISLGR